MKKIDPDNTRTIYVGGVYEVDKNVGGTVTSTTTYYPAADALRVNGGLYFVVKDHLGSTSIVSNFYGNVVGEQRYLPYGQTRFTSGAAIPTDRLFTGQREITGLGIYHYNARFYSPTLGRFLSADTIVPGHANPQNLNRFSYTLNNPLRYTDPTGHWIDEGGGFATNKKKNAGLKIVSGRRVGNSDGDGTFVTPEPQQPSSVDGNDSGVNQHKPLIYCAEGFLNCSASFTQDIATSIDFFSTGLTLVFAVEGCKAGLKGCAAGYGLGLTVYNMGFNPLESAMSGISLTLTFFSELSEKGELEMGGPTETSFVTFLVGGAMGDPIGDLIIDGYASGYNHGFFNGVRNILNGGPILNTPFIWK